MTGEIGAVLERALQAAQEWEAAPRGSTTAEEMAELATGGLVLIDAWLSRGGELPLAWAQAARPGWGAAGGP